MSKLLTTLLVGSSLLGGYAFAGDDQDIVKFLKDNIGKNPNIVSLDVKVVDKKELDKPKGWDAYVIAFDGVAKVGGEDKNISQRSIYFVKDGMVAPEIIDMKTGLKLNDTITPKFKDEYYKKANLLYGDVDATHKVAIFSDPLCPFCRSYVPGALVYMKKYPRDFAVYYYHFPLEALHPASPTLCRAAIYLALQGDKDAVLRLYGLKIDYREKDEQKILDVLNTAFNTKITIENIHSLMVEEELKEDQDLATAMLVNGTPSVYFDGEKDATKNKYKSVKVH